MLFRPEQPDSFLVRHRFWLLPLAAGLILSALVYGILPLFGVGQFARLFSLKRVMMLVGGFVGAIGYVYYWRWIKTRPEWLVGFMVLAWPVVAHLNGHLLLAGINLRLRPLLIVTVAIPALWIAWRNRQIIWNGLPHFKIYLAFLGWLLLYFIFYNSHAQDPLTAGAGSDGSLGLIQLMSYLYCALGMALSAVAILKNPNPQQFFDKFNQGLLWISAGVALYTIVGYPTLLTSLWLDGFLRALGIFAHPNPFAHHMGLLLLYLFGLFLYYQGSNHSRISHGLLYVSLALNVVAFLLGLSKTAIAVFTVCATIMLLMNLSSPVVRQHGVKLAVGAIILAPLGLFAYQLITGQSFMEIIESRLEETDSLEWRTQVWEYLIANIHGWWIITGHGFTNANEWVYQLTLDVEKNAKPLMMVHNGYIALLYDLGIMGYLFFVAVFRLMGSAFTGWLNRQQLPEIQPLQTTILAMSLYFLVVCGFDEMTYMFDAPMMFWILTSLMFTLCSLNLKTPETTFTGGVR